MTVGISDAPHPQGPANPNDPYLAADGTREPYWKEDVTPYQQLYILTFFVTFPFYVLYNAITKSDPKDYQIFAFSLLLCVPMGVLSIWVPARRLRWRHKNLPWYSQIEPYSIDSFCSAKTQTIAGAFMLLAMAIWTPIPVAGSDSAIKFYLICSIVVLGGFTLFKGIRRLAWRKTHPELIDNHVPSDTEVSSEERTTPC